MSSDAPSEAHLTAAPSAAEVDVGEVAAVPLDRGRCAEAGPFSLALFRAGEEVFALENACPHRGGPLCEGDVKDGVVYCPLHAWGFDLRSGRAVNVRWAGARVFPARVVAGRVLVALPPEVQLSPELAEELPEELREELKGED